MDKNEFNKRLSAAFQSYKTNRQQQTPVLNDPANIKEALEFVETYLDNEVFPTIREALDCFTVSPVDQCFAPTIKKKVRTFCERLTDEKRRKK